MANPWRLLPPDAQAGLQRALVDPTIRSYFTGASRDWVPPGIPGARSFGAWYDEYYRGPNRPPVDEASVFAEWRFNHAMTEVQRNSLLCVYAKLKAEGLWDQVDTIQDANENGAIEFVPKQSVDAFKSFISIRGYGNWWIADNKSRWGMRSRFRGAQLHFRGPLDKPALVNAHIDLHNPGDPPGNEPSNALEELPQAVNHLSQDLSHRTTTHRPAQLRAGLAADGITAQQVP